MRTSPLAVSDVAPGVRQLTIRSVVSIHMYLLETADGVVAFDTGIKGSGPEILTAAGGSVAKVVLSHGHVDHRGGASELGAPIYCHPREVEHAEGDGGQDYIDWDLIPPTREGLSELHAGWDGGPVSIAGTVAEGEKVGSFRVVDVPGHAPGLIALYRPSDRLLLAPDVIYTIDTRTCVDGPTRIPHPAFNWDNDLARGAVERLRDLDATSLWTGHGRHLVGDVDSQLETASTATWPDVVERRETGRTPLHRRDPL